MSKAKIPESKCVSLLFQNILFYLKVYLNLKNKYDFEFYFSELPMLVLTDIDS